MSSSFSLEILDNTSTYPDIAMVKPTFTAAAYSGFYSFFAGASSGSINEDEGHKYFRRGNRDSWSYSFGAVDFIDGLIDDGYPEEKIHIIRDVDVHLNDLYTEEGLMKYSTLTFFHSEYITIKQYHNIVNYIQAGGNVIVLNGNGFFAEVDYNNDTNMVSLVSGHGWEFDGENGTRARTYRRFWNSIENNEHTKWLGSRYSLGPSTRYPTDGAVFNVSSGNPHPVAIKMKELGFDRVAPGYSTYEDNSLVTPNAHIIADWKISSDSFNAPDLGYKIYETFPEGPYGGSLMHFAFFGTFVLGNSDSARQTYIQAVLHQNGRISEPWIRYPMQGAVLNQDIPLVIEGIFRDYNVIIDGQDYGELPRYSDLSFLDEGTHNLTIIFDGPLGHSAKYVIFNIDRTAPEIYTKEEMDAGQISKLYISQNDTNPRFYTATWYGNENGPIHFRSANSTGAIQTLNFTRALKDYDTTGYIKIDSIDAAGNTNRLWYYINKNNDAPLIKLNQPKVVQTGADTAYVEMSPPDNDDYLTLRVSSDQGYSWNKVDFSAVNGKYLANISKNSQSIWYRVAVHNSTDFVYYVKSVHVFNWDQDIISTGKNNLMNSSSSKYISIRSINGVNFSATLDIVTDSGKILQQYKVQNTQTHNFTFTLSDDSRYQFAKISVNSSFTDYSRKYLVINNDVPVSHTDKEDDYHVTTLSGASSTEYTAYSKIIFENYSEILFPWQQFRLNSDKVNSTFSLIEFDRNHTIIHNTTFTILEFFSTNPPIIHLEVESYQDFALIYWNISDTRDTGWYYLEIDNQPLTNGTWYEFEQGSYYFRFGNMTTYNIMLTVIDNYDNIITKEIMLSNPKFASSNSSSPSGMLAVDPILLGSAVMIVSIPILVLLWRKRLTSS